MAWKSGFFNSVNGDRVYNAQEMNEIFKGLITNGVYEAVGNKLAVQPNSGMTIQIASGRGWFNNHWVTNATEYLTTLEASDVTLNRYAAVCVRVDDNDSVRSAEPYIKYGDYATNPTKPLMTRSDKINEYCLAYIYIKAGVSEIKASDIEDTRHNTELCGYVRGLIDQIDANTLFTQYEEIFKEWFNSLDEYMDENIEAKLANDVLELKGRVLKNVITIEADKWTDKGNGIYTQTIFANGVTADTDIMVSPIAEDKDRYIIMNCEAVDNGYHSITFECTNPSNVNVNVEVIMYNIDALADLLVESVNTFNVTDDGNGNVTVTN